MLEEINGPNNVISDPNRKGRKESGQIQYMILFQLPKDLVAGMRKTSRYVTALKQIFSRVHLEFSHVIDISMVMLMNCLLVCRDLIGDHRKRKGCMVQGVHQPKNCSRYLQELHWKNFRHFLTRKLFPSLLPLS